MGWEGWRKPWLTLSSKFWGVNTSIMAVFKLPVDVTNLGNGKVTVRSCEQVQASSNTWLYVSWAFPQSSVSIAPLLSLCDLRPTFRCLRCSPGSSELNIKGTKIVVPELQVSCGRKNSIMFFPVWVRRKICICSGSFDIQCPKNFFDQWEHL